MTENTIRKITPIIALVVGFVWAFITLGVHSMLFTLLPLLAFTFGYFYSWGWGLLNGFMLFLGYIPIAALTWWLGDGYRISIDYVEFVFIVAFIIGGFSLLLIGALAPFVRRGIRKVGSISVLVIIVFVMVWCGFLAWPVYTY